MEKILFSATPDEALSQIRGHAQVISGEHKTGQDTDVSDPVDSAADTSGKNDVDTAALAKTLSELFTSTPGKTSRKGQANPLSSLNGTPFGGALSGVAGGVAGGALSGAMAGALAGGVAASLCGPAGIGAGIAGVMGVAISGIFKSKTIITITENKIAETPEQIEARLRGEVRDMAGHLRTETRIEIEEEAEFINISGVRLSMNRNNMERQ